MQVKQIVAGVGIAATMGMGGLAMAGTASAETGSGSPGAPGTVTSTNGNDIGTVNGNRLRVNILSNNTVTFKVVAFNGNSFLNGNLSGNAVNSPGAYSTTINKTWQKFVNSFNTVTVTKNETNTTTVTTNNSSCQGNCAPNGQPGEPGH